MYSTLNTPILNASKGTNSKTRVGDRQRKSGFCGILAQKVSVRTYARINYAPVSNLIMYTNGS